MWSIICDARKGAKLGVYILGLVDRKLSRKLWWTSDDPYLLLKYEKLDAARYAVSRLRKNNARIIESSQAVKLLEDQNQGIRSAECASYADPGWDAHKSYL